MAGIMHDKHEPCQQRLARLMQGNNRSYNGWHGVCIGKNRAKPSEVIHALRSMVRAGQPECNPRFYVTVARIMHNGRLKFEQRDSAHERQGRNPTCLYSERTGRTRPERNLRCTIAQAPSQTSIGMDCAWLNGWRKQMQIVRIQASSQEGLNKNANDYQQRPKKRRAGARR